MLPRPPFLPTKRASPVRTPDKLPKWSFSQEKSVPQSWEEPQHNEKEQAPEPKILTIPPVGPWQFT